MSIAVASLWSTDERKRSSASSTETSESSATSALGWSQAASAELTRDRRTSWLLPFAADLAPGAGRLDERRWALVGRDIRRELASRQIPAVVGTLGRERHLAGVAGLDAPARRVALAGTVAEAVLQAARRAAADAEVVVCAGRLSPSWRELSTGLRDTVAALPRAAPGPLQSRCVVSGRPIVVSRYRRGTRARSGCRLGRGVLVAYRPAVDCVRDAQARELETLDALEPRASRRSPAAAGRP